MEAATRTIRSCHREEVPYGREVPLEAGDPGDLEEGRTDWHLGSIGLICSVFGFEAPCDAGPGSDSLTGETVVANSLGGTDDDSFFAPKVTLTWTPADNQLYYFSFAESFKPKGISTLLGGTGAFYDEECGVEPGICAQTHRTPLCRKADNYSWARRRAADLRVRQRALFSRLHKSMFLTRLL